jgi:hypothetical protein
VPDGPQDRTRRDGTDTTPRASSSEERGDRVDHAAPVPVPHQFALKVAFDIEDVGHGAVKLTVTHDGFAPGSAVLPAITEGWPAVLASLKTLLETGSSLRTS